MTGSDLCASAKPWDLQMQTVEVIYDEFYKQVCGTKTIYLNFFVSFIILYIFLMVNLRITYELYNKQGDLELESGRVPVPIMDRSFDEQQPLHQVDLVIYGTSEMMLLLFVVFKCSFIILSNTPLKIFCNVRYRLLFVIGLTLT